VTLILPNDILNDTPADAAPVEENYNYIQQYINTNVILRDGSVKMTGQLTLVGDPVSDDDAVRKGYVDTFLPIGIMLPWLGIDAPAGKWALANGASLQVTQYQKLYNIIGHRFGGTGGSFNLPNMAGVVPVGQKASDVRYGTVGNYGGSTKVPVPSHVHGMDHNHPSSVTTDETTNHVHAITHNHGTVNTNDAGSHAHAGSFQSNADVSGASSRFVSYTSSGSHAAITDTAADHQHALDMPQFIGDSGSPKTKHKHNFDTPNFVGNTKAYSLEVTDPDNRQSTTDFYAPFVVINYIVRVQ
jgi:microcystin-dependent protein